METFALGTILPQPSVTFPLIIKSFAEEKPEESNNIKKVKDNFRQNAVKKYIARDKFLFKVVVLLIKSNKKK